MHRISLVSLKLALIAGLLFCAGMATAPAMAELITFKFTGAVTHVGNHLSGGPFSLGQSVTGFYTFNSETLNTGSGSTGEYKGALNPNPLTYPSTNLKVTFGTYVALLGRGTNEIEVKNHYGLSDDSYEVEGVFAGEKVNGYKPRSFELELEHPSSNQFDMAKLPLTPPSVSAFEERTFRLDFGSGGSHNRVLVTIKDITVVPLPPAVILFGAGLVALIGLGARNRQSAHARLAGLAGKARQGNGLRFEVRG